MPRKSFRDWWPLFASIVSFIVLIVIPIVKFAVTPTPFKATVHYEAVFLPSAVTKSWPFPHRDKNPRASTQNGVHHPFDPPQELLIITLINARPSVRHNVSMTIDGLLTFAGIELGTLSQSTATARAWLTPEFQEKSGKLLLPPISELAAETTFQVFIWGHFTVFGPQIELTSSEGLGPVDFQHTIGGWPLTLALNAWWIVMVLCGGVGIWFLRRFNERQRPC
ncbi:MAG: hypothetical protein ABSH44_18415 [Bryobacteraceae bacterium]|jgi:hypothetical protein